MHEPQPHISTAGSCDTALALCSEHTLSERVMEAPRVSSLCILFAEEHRPSCFSLSSQSFIVQTTDLCQVVRIMVPHLPGQASTVHSIAARILGVLRSSPAYGPEKAKDSCSNLDIGDVPLLPRS